MNQSGSFLIRDGTGNGFILIPRQRRGGMDEVSVTNEKSNYPTLLHSSLNLTIFTKNTTFLIIKIRKG